MWQYNNELYHYGIKGMDDIARDNQEAIDMLRSNFEKS